LECVSFPAIADTGYFLRFLGFTERTDFGKIREKLSDWEATVLRKGDREGPGARWIDVLMSRASIDFIMILKNT